MANVRIKDLTTTAATTASDDFFGVDGATNGTRKLNAYNPTFGGNVTASGNLTVSGGSTSGQAFFNSAGSYGFIQLTDAGSTAGNALIGTGAMAAGASVGDVTIRQNNDSKAFLVSGVNNNWFKVTSSAATILGNLTVSGTGTSSVAGNFLIGTTTDGGQKLQVNGSASFAGSIAGTSAALTLTTTASNSNFRIDAIPSGTATSASAVFYNNSAAGSAQYGRIGMLNGTNNVNMVVGTGANSGVAGSLILQTAGTDALTLDSSQNATFAKKIGIGGTAPTNGFLEITGDGATGTRALYIQGGAAFPTANSILRIDAAGGTAFQVFGSGNVNVLGALAIGNTVQTAVGVASTHKVTISIGGSTYYLLATNV
jgi:hypothetical protein